MLDQMQLWTVISLALILFTATAGFLWVVSQARRKARLARAQEAESASLKRQTDEIWIIVNPVKPSNYEKFREQVDAGILSTVGTTPHWIETTVEDPGTGQAVEALRHRPSLVIVAGGDGTVRAVAAALAHSRVPLALLPVGTGNLLARNLGIPLDTEAALQIALEPVSRRVDLAWLRAERVKERSECPAEGALLKQAGVSSLRQLPEGVPEPRTTEHAYLVIAGVGFDGETMANTSAKLKKQVGWTAYVFTALSALRIERMKATVTIFKKDDQPDHDSSASTFEKNNLVIPKSVQDAVRASRTLGAPDGVSPSLHSDQDLDMTAVRARTILFANCGELPFAQLAPDAEIDDGKLDVIAIDTKGGLLGWAYLSMKIYGNQAGFSPVNTKHDMAQIQFRQTSEVRVDISKAYPVQVDGDPIGSARTLIARVDPRALLVRVARGSAAAIPEWDRKI